MSARRRCAACGVNFKVLPQVPDQSYCPSDACQRERRKLWQRERRARDLDYRENQARAQEAWLARNPGYWREYRRRNPEYAQRNRERQRERARERARERVDPGVAKTAASDVAALIASGLYTITVVAVNHVAKMDSSYLVLVTPVRKHKDL